MLIRFVDGCCAALEAVKCITLQADCYDTHTRIQQRFSHTDRGSKFMIQCNTHKNKPKAKENLKKKYKIRGTIGVAISCVQKALVITLKMPKSRAHKRKQNYA